MFTSCIKRETRKFHVVVVQCSSVMLVQSCCFANLTLFCRSRCRRRRRCLSSLIASHRQTKQNRRLWAQFVVVGSLPRSERFFFPGYCGFPLSSQTNIINFQFDQESGRREPLSGFATSKSLPRSERFFSRVLRFSPLFKNQHFQFPIRPGIR